MESIVCAECGTPATFPDRRVRRYCSALCSKRHKKRVQRARRPVGSKRKTYAGYRPILLRDPCSYCSGVSEAGDHIVAQAAGGADEWHNLTGACTACNSAKGTKPLLEYLTYRLAA